MNRDPHFIRDVSLASIWLLFLAIVNQQSRVPIVSIFPYLFPVIVVAWRYGSGWGFLIAALGTLAAVPGDYMNDHNMDDLYWAVFTTYLKLTVAATGIILGKTITNRQRGDD